MRHWLISIPHSCSRSAVHYPAINLLYGSALFQPTIAAAQFLAHNNYVGAIPEVIVI